MGLPASPWEITGMDRHSAGHVLFRGSSFHKATLVKFILQSLYFLQLFQTRAIKGRGGLFGSAS